LPVIEANRKSNPPGYVCQVSENRKLFIPEWVTYPDAEKGCSIQKLPQISFENLLKLSEYLSNENSTKHFREDMNEKTTTL